MIRIGIIGFGKMGRVRGDAIRESGRGEVVAIFDPADAGEHDCSLRAESVESIFSDRNVDAVFICTPNYLNKSLTIAGLHAGKHVFCEKPPAFSAIDVEEIREVEYKSGKRLMYGFNHRHHESIRRMKEIQDSGEMGRILWMRGRYGKEVNESFLSSWRANKDFSGGGIMLDQGIHMLDLFLHLSGNFDDVHAFVSNLFWKIEGIEDNVFAILRSSETGICASLHSTMTQWRYLFSLEVFLEGGALILNGLKTSSGTYGDEALAIKRNTPHGRFTGEEHIVYHSDTSWLVEITHFIDCIENSESVRHGSSADALRLMRLMDKIYGNEK